MRRFYATFIRGKLLIYLLIFVGYFGVRFFLAYNRWSDEETAVMQKLTLYKQQLDRLRTGALGRDTVASVEPGAVAIPSKVYDRNNKLIGEFYTERRSLLNFEDFPPHLVDALIASEDRKFYEHGGVDYGGMFRGVVFNLVRFRRPQGGSTITQQLAKVLFTNQERTLDRKFFEFFCARAIESKYSKKEILEMYLNLIYMGHGIYGFETAAQFYFNKSAKNVTPGEAAGLVGIIPNPKIYSPLTDLPRFLERQGSVLHSLVVTKKISDEKAKAERARFFRIWRIARKESKSSAIGDFPDRLAGKNYASFFLDYLRQKLMTTFTQEALTRSGLRIYTTLDLNRQIAAQKSVKAAVELQKQHYEKLIAAAKKKNKSQAKIHELERALATTNAAFISIEPKSGYILAMVGGAEFSAQNQFNRALKADRQIGSTIKPLLYYLTIAKHIYTPASLVEDAPIQDYQNYDGKFMGKMTLRDALKLSRNPTAIRALQKLDFDDVRNLFQEILQIPAKEIEKKIPRELGVALGSSSFTPIQLTQMYAAMLNQGKRVEPRDLLRIEDNQGRQIWEAPEAPAPQQVMDPAAAYVTLTMMQAVVDGGGTAQGAMRALRNSEGKLPFDVAGKTGTTSKYVDAWFVGLVSDEATVMWVGNDANTTLGAGRSGSGLCAPRFADYIRATRMGDKPRNFADVFNQEQIVRKSICSATGLVSRFPGACEDEVPDQAFIRGTEPNDFDPAGAPPEPEPQQPTPDTIPQGVKPAPPIAPENKADLPAPNDTPEKEDDQ